MAEGRPRGRAEVVEAILRSARQLIAERGPDVSLRDIAAHAHVNPGLIYQYLGTKDDLVRAVYRAAAESAAVRLREAADLEGALQILMELGDGTTARLIGWAALDGEMGPDAFRDSPALEVIAALASAGAKEGGRHVSNADARVFAALVMAISIGWRLFRSTSLYAAGLDGAHPERYDEQVTRHLDRLAAEFIATPTK